MNGLPPTSIVICRKTIGQCSNPRRMPAPRSTARWPAIRHLPYCDLSQTRDIAMDPFEIWLRTNRRALSFGTVLPALFALLVLLFRIRDRPVERGLVALDWSVHSPHWPVQRRDSAAPAPRAACRVSDGIRAVLSCARPADRRARKSGRGLFSRPGPVMLTGFDNQRDSTVNLVARISQRDPSWANRDVKPALGAGPTATSRFAAPGVNRSMAK